MAWLWSGMWLSLLSCREGRAASHGAAFYWFYLFKYKRAACPPTHCLEGTHGSRRARPALRGEHMAPDAWPGATGTHCLQKSRRPSCAWPSGYGDQQIWGLRAAVLAVGSTKGTGGGARAPAEPAPCRGPHRAPPVGEAAVPHGARHSSLWAALATITSLDSSALKAPGLWDTAVLVTSNSSVFRGTSLSLSNAAFE